MIFAGLYLAAKDENSSALAIIKDCNTKPKLIFLKNLKTDREIIKSLKSIDYLALDAPLIKENILDGYHQALKQLTSLGLKLTSPSFSKDLLLRTQKIIAKLPKEIKVIEVHSKSSALMLGVNPKRSVINQSSLKKFLDINNLAIANKHQFNAVVASYTAFLYKKKLVRKIGVNGNYIILPYSQKIKLAVLDMDGTLTKPTSSWEHIHRQLGTWENGGAKYLKQFLGGEITYEDFAKLDTSQWKGTSLKQIKEIASKVKYNPGVKELMKFLVDKKIKIAIISGGLSVISDKIASDFKVGDIFINDLVVDNGVVNGDVKINVAYNGKLPIYKKLLNKLNIKPYQVLTVGDTNGDIPLFKNCGLAVAINPINDIVKKAADFEVKSLAEIVNLLDNG